MSDFLKHWDWINISSRPLFDIMPIKLEYLGSTLIVDGIGL